MRCAQQDGISSRSWCLLGFAGSVVLVIAVLVYLRIKSLVAQFQDELATIFPKLQILLCHLQIVSLLGLLAEMFLFDFSP